MHRFGLVLGLVAGCAPHPLTPLDWRSQPPAAPCETTETYTDAMGTDQRIARYDASGRLVFAQTRLTYDGRGFEHVIWDAGRVARIDTFYEQDAREGNCDVEGGCDEPAYRTVERTHFRYDSAGRLRHEARTKWTYAANETGGWTQSGDEDHERGFRYEGGKLVAIEHDRGDERFEHEHGHPVRRHFAGRTSQFEWQGNRLVMFRWFDYAQSFEYDDRGRLVREVLAKKSDGAAQPQTTEWAYNAAGHVLSETMRTAHAVRTQSFDYDDQGRLARTSQDGRPIRTYAYGAACPARLNAVRAPTAERRAGLDLCIGSPGYAFDSCFYDVP
jgi:YD repeat-containing protein